ncbi:DNA-(apurinic or apyrimidinic site) lyase [Methylomonas methanica]|uniref:DNA-(Apurinic or apyrimidinic site) lyase n=1 Tax=Methylomonas methanica TaxID=421 RepID=A0A177MXH3_METMH|nr:exodeoxyribonuclease III [Methylomonas methanica]OAI09589.1 DNA-(apurinic or apyrimidinic site) lyase [Methylomonas methanica]
MLRIISANLNGIRSATRKGFYDWLDTQTPDFVCLQELKAQAGDMTAEMLTPNGLHGYFHYAQKKGYSGVGIYSKQPADKVIEGLGHADIDSEGRYLEVQVGNLSVISLYLPSGSSSEERQTVKYSVMERFYPHLAELKASGREVVICGDWNIAHQAADLKNWRGNQKNSGFLPAERAWMTQVYDELGWVDVYRSLHPDATDACYTWWSNRGQAWAKNVGWRIDYQVATPSIAGSAQSTSIFKEQRFSDHAPLIIDYAY